ncbi:LTA synthase family protein [Cohnella nanjingensis]|uniref:LTA synthase family protein n=1 Tax=Cohnella nanjingensis TaxID=1387779 RepID=A0A7X0VHV1_9BACL|nr:LTA synthase family protein [Cohnella nanjingensis]MBB6673868.1 LTA synthase family protein [Cohnella nanjingensis]
MITQLQTAARRGVRLSAAGLGLWPYWGAMLLIASMLYKLNWLDAQLDVGGMNHWKRTVNLGAMVLITFWTVWLGRRTRAVVLTILDLVLSVAVFADLVYFRYFKDFLSVPVLLQAGQVSSLEDSIWSLIHKGDFILFADLPVAIALAVFVLWRFRPSRVRVRAYGGGYESGGRRSRVGLLLRLALGAALLASGIMMIAVPVNTQKNGWARGLFDGNWWNIPIYNVTGLFGFHGYDTYRYAKEHWLGGGVTEAEIQEARAWFDGRKQLQTQAEAEPLFGAAKGKNVLMIQAEAFQSFVIGQSVNGVPITPNLNELIGKSAYFPNFYHQTSQGRTSDADFLTSCSLHPMPSGSVFIRFADHAFDCLPSVLNEQGYDTTVHHAYDGSFWNRNNMYHNMDYAKFYNIKDFDIDEPIGWSLGDKSFLQQTVDQIKDRGKSPFYAFAITISSHHPFNLPSTATQFDAGEFSGTTFGSYLQAAHYVDEAVGELVDRLKEEGLWEDTVLLFYGDHDNSLYDLKPYEKLLGRSLSEVEQDANVRKVPFFIHFPNDANAGVNEKAVGQLDTTPTIMQLLGIPIGDRKMMGVSMLSAAAKPVVFRNGGYTDGASYYVPGSDGVPEHGACYSLPDGKATDPAACQAGREAANLELAVSDRVVEHNLLPDMRLENASE